MMEILLTYYPLFIKLLSLAAAVSIVLLLYSTLIRTEKLKKSWEKLNQQLSQGHLLKKEEIEKVKQLQGEAFKLPLTERIEVQIIYSGLQNKLPWLNGITYIFFTLLFTGMVIILGLLSSTVPNTLLAAAIVLLLPYLAIHLQANRRYEAVKKDFPTFMRVISSFSKSYQDILTILEASSSYIGNPIRESVSMAVIKARANGDVRGAMKWLSDHIEYGLFKDLIKALEITSRHSLAYGDIIEQFMVIAEKKNASVEKQKVIVRKGRMGVAVMLLLGIVMFYMVIVSVNGSNSVMEGIMMLQAGVAGQVLLGYMVCVFAGALWYMLFGMQVKD